MWFYPLIQKSQCWNSTCIPFIVSNGQTITGILISNRKNLVLCISAIVFVVWQVYSQLIPTLRVYLVNPLVSYGINQNKDVSRITSKTLKNIFIDKKKFNYAYQSSVPPKHYQIHTYILSNFDKSQLFHSFFFEKPD